MIDLGDFKTIELSNKMQKRYHLYCDRCGSDRGYQPKHQDKFLCRSCSGQANPHRRKKITEEVRKNYTNVNFEDSRYERNASGRHYTLYRMGCRHCGADRGYKPLAQSERKCRSCQAEANSERTRGFCFGEFGKRPARASHQTALCRRMRSLLVTRLKYRLVAKEKFKTMKLLDFSLDELVKSIESKFQSGMSWDNMGEWHIDHATPDSWFEYGSSEDEGFKQSWSLSNLQPMWAHHNIAKGNRYSGQHKKREEE